MRNPKSSIALFVILLTLTILVKAEVVNELTGKVVRVIDGDTFVIKIGNGYEKVRLIGVDCPELEPWKNIPGEYDSITNLTYLAEWGWRAKIFAEKVLDHKTVLLRFDNLTGLRDKYGRLLAYVYVNGTDFNALLIKKGLARVYYRFNFTKKSEYLHLERFAREHRIGLWNYTGRIIIVPSPTIIPSPRMIVSPKIVRLSTIPPGGNATFTIVIRNVGDWSIYGVHIYYMIQTLTTSLTLSPPIPSDWIRFDKSYIPQIPPHKNAKVNCTITVPIYAKAGSYYGLIEINSENDGVKFVEIYLRVGKDTIPPTIVVSYPRDGEIVHKPYVRVEGEACDNVGVKEIEINSRYIPIIRPLSFGVCIPFNATVQLKPGLNEIHVKVEDFAGNVNESTIHVYYLSVSHLRKSNLKIDVKGLKESYSPGENVNVVIKIEPKSDDIAKSMANRSWKFYNYLDEPRKLEVTFVSKETHISYTKSTTNECLTFKDYEISSGYGVDQIKINVSGYVPQIEEGVKVFTFLKISPEDGDIICFNLSIKGVSAPTIRIESSDEEVSPGDKFDLYVVINCANVKAVFVNFTYPKDLVSVVDTKTYGVFDFTDKVITGNGYVKYLGVSTRFENVYGKVAMITFSVEKNTPTGSIIRFSAVSANVNGKNVSVLPCIVNVISQPWMNYDRDHNGKINDQELINAILDWFNNKIPDNRLINVIIKWLNG